MADELTSVNTDETRREAAPVELFFDLVFVFAFLQLSHHLSAHLDWRTSAETAVLLVAVLTVWTHTSWAVTVVRDKRAQPALVLLIIMAIGLFMHAAISEAFGAAAWMFAGGFVAIEVGRTLWTLVHTPDHRYREHYQRVLIWTLASVPLWFGGAMVDSESRLWWWGAAAVLELVGTWTAHPVPGRTLESRAMPFDAAHFLERCTLFLLIALGETILAIGLTLADVGIRADTVAVGALALLVTIALWSIIFGSTRTQTLRTVDRVQDTVVQGRAGANSVFVIVFGLVLLAVANQQIIIEPFADHSVAYVAALIVGPILFLAGHALYIRTIPGSTRRYHAFAASALVLVGLLAFYVPALVALGFVAMILLALAMLDRKVTAERA